MFPWVQLITAVAVIALIYYIVTNAFRRLQQKDLPPGYDGWLPWLGCAIEFGKRPLTFIEEKREQLGPVFTLKVAGERMTFLTEPSDFHYFFQSTNVDFQKAVQDAVQNVGSLSKEAFFKTHTKMHDTVKGRLATANLPALYQNLFLAFRQHLSEIKLENDGEAAKLDLSKIVRSSMYKSVMDNLFGDGIYQPKMRHRKLYHEGKMMHKKRDKNKNSYFRGRLLFLFLCQKTFKEMERNFVIFDEQFEYGARLPPMFIKEWATAKKWLLSMFSKAFSQMMTDMPKDTVKQTLAQTVLCQVDKEYGANWGLMFLWAALANAIPQIRSDIQSQTVLMTCDGMLAMEITFWTLSLIYTHPHILVKVQAEVDAAFQGQEEDTILTAMPYTKWCILEAIRLRSPGIIARRVVKDFTVQGFTVPSGDLLMVSPFWAHRNPHFYPEPDAFKPERWEKLLEKNSFPEEFIAFGGGRYQCPGRWFALMEMHLYVGMFVNMFDCKLVSGIPDLCKLHLVGTQQPVQECPIFLTKHKAL